MHLPRDVTVTLVAQSLTETTFPFSNSVFESIPGLANPTSGVIEKSGPSPSPIPAFNVNKISIILFQYIHNFLYYIRDKEKIDSMEQKESPTPSAYPPLNSQSQKSILVTSPVTERVPFRKVVILF